MTEQSSSSDLHASLLRLMQLGGLAAFMRPMITIMDAYRPGRDRLLPHD